MSLLQCMLITIHRQEKCMFSCLLLLGKELQYLKKEVLLSISFEWHPRKLATLISFTYSSDVSPPEGNKVDRVCDAIRAKLELAGHNKYVQHLVFFLADLCSW